MNFFFFKLEIILSNRSFKFFSFQSKIFKFTKRLKNVAKVKPHVDPKKNNNKNVKNKILLPKKH